MSAGTYVHQAGSYCGEVANDFQLNSAGAPASWEGFTFGACKLACDANSECASFSVTNANWNPYYCVHYTASECEVTAHANWERYVKLGIFDDSFLNY